MSGRSGAALKSKANSLSSAQFTPQDQGSRPRDHPTAVRDQPRTEIYTQDTERKQTFNEAVRTYESLAEPIEPKATNW